MSAWLTTQLELEYLPVTDESTIIIFISESQPQISKLQALVDDQGHCTSLNIPQQQSTTMPLRYIFGTCIHSVAQRSSNHLARVGS